MERTENFVALALGVIVLLALGFYLVAFPFHSGGKSPQSEAKTNLASIATASISYYAEKDNWGSSFDIIGWGPQGTPKFVYFITPTEHLGRPLEELKLKLPIDFKSYGVPQPGVSAEGFTAVAIGNIDSDPMLDVWWIDNRKDPNNSQNDVNE